MPIIDPTRLQQANIILNVLRQCKRLSKGRNVKIYLTKISSKYKLRNIKSKKTKEIPRVIRNNKYAEELAWSLGISYEFINDFLAMAYRYLYNTLGLNQLP